MSVFMGSRRSITPNTSNDNYTLDAPASKSCIVLEVMWGGELTTSTAMNTRWARSSGSNGTGTGGNVAKRNTNQGSNGINFYTNWNTTQPTLDAGDLVMTSWNAHGGVVRWLAAPGEEHVILGAAQASNRNSVGTGTSSYTTVWNEDN